MILVDDAGGVYSRIDHSPWNGCTLADFVMPFFLFIVGVAIALALKVIIKFCILYKTCKMSFFLGKKLVRCLSFNFYVHCHGLI